MIRRPVVIPLLVLICGIVLAEAFLPTFILREHYSRHLDTARCFRYLVKTDNGESGKFRSYVATASQYFDGNAWHKTAGDVVIYLSKEEIPPLFYGDEVESDAEPQRIRNFEVSTFDYAKYMRRKRLYHNVFIRDCALRHGKKTGGIMFLAAKCRRAITQRIESSALSEKNAALAASLLLGNRKGLDKEVKVSFSVAGLSHLLCVSGLHIGLIIAMFDILLKNLHFLGLRGFYLRRLLLVLLSWTVAFLVGCTPSALRVALMLTLTILTGTTAYRSDRLNVLFVTAFLLLLFNPLLLFDLSFQLSFLAVGGIFTIMPKADRFIESHVPRGLKTLCRNASLTMSAQLFTLPIVVLRFHNLPLLSLFANLIAVPLIGATLFTIIMLVVFASTPYLGEVIALIANLELSLLQTLAQTTESLTRTLLSLF